MGVLLVTLILVFTIISTAQSSEITYNLPNHIIPTHYQLNITLISNSFEGEVAINITVYEKSKSIMLHAFSQMNINQQDIKLQQNEKQINALNVHFNQDNAILTIYFSEEFNPGDYILKIRFTSQSNLMYGLRFASYESENGENELYWATHFEPIYARRVFPCFDEPQLKATFQVQITHLYSYQAVSNTEVEKIANNKDMTKTLFKKTPKMSTYTLAFEVSKFKANELISNDFNKKYRIYAKLNLVNSTEFALNLTKSSVDYFENVLGIDYGLPKLDGVFIPEFPGGMENWGLIVYGTMIFPSEQEHDIHNAVDLVCHEVAHQWFGNLVTCSSWDYLWLNEGFASYYSMKCGDAIFGNNSTRRFIIKNIIELNSIFELDSLESSTSLNNNVKNPQQLMQYKFDSITYNKGGLIVRFMSTFLPNYHSLITKYLKKYSYSSVNSDDLFNSLNENSGLPAHVKDIMHNWVETPGYPLITLNISKNKAGIVIEIEQERFLFTKTNENNQKWWIPITLAFESAPDFDNTNVVRWMRDNENKITIEITGKTNDWVIANLQAMVFCRVNYDLDNWNRIIKFLKGPNFEKIHVINRARLLDDAYYLAKTGKLSENVILDLLGYLKQETDPLVIQMSNGILEIYKELLQKTKISSDFELYSNKIKSRTNDKIGSLQFKSDTLQLIKESIQSIEHRNNNDNALYKLAKNLFTNNQFKKLEALISKLSDPSTLEDIQRLKTKLKEHLKLNEVLKKKFLNGASLRQAIKYFKH